MVRATHIFSKYVTVLLKSLLVILKGKYWIPYENYCSNANISTKSLIIIT